MLMVRSAHTPDLPVIRDIEVAAGQVFCDVGMAEIAEDEPPSREMLAAYLRAGYAWVAVEDGVTGGVSQRRGGEVDGRPVAYLVAAEVDGNLHIEQVSVHPDHARRGIGRSLLDHTATVATVEGLPALTLTTFADVPWNAPYYTRCGFEPIPDEQLTPGLRAIRRRETEHGLDQWPRICMRRLLVRSAAG